LAHHHHLADVLFTADFDQARELAERNPITARGERLDLRRCYWISLGQLSRLIDRKSTRLNSSHVSISYAVFCLKKKKSVSQLPSPHGLPPAVRLAGTAP